LLKPPVGTKTQPIMNIFNILKITLFLFLINIPTNTEMSDFNTTIDLIELVLRMAEFAFKAIELWKKDKKEEAKPKLPPSPPPQSPDSTA